MYKKSNQSNLLTVHKNSLALYSFGFSRILHKPGCVVCQDPKIRVKFAFLSPKKMSDLPN